MISSGRLRDMDKAKLIHARDNHSWVCRCLSNIFLRLCSEGTVVVSSGRAFQMETTLSENVKAYLEFHSLIFDLLGVAPIGVMMTS